MKRDRIFIYIIRIYHKTSNNWKLGECVKSRHFETRKWREQCGLPVSEVVRILFVNNENNNFTKEIKHVVCASIAC